MKPEHEHWTSPGAHAAWLDSLTEAEKVTAYTPPGYQHHAILASYVKRQLATMRMSTGDRLRLLEGLNELIHGSFTKDALAAVMPADDVSAEMIQEAMNLDRGLPAPTAETGGADHRAFGVLTSWEVLGHLIQLNPSLIDAMRICGGWRGSHNPVDKTPQPSS